MPPVLNIIAIIVFAIGGLGTVYFAWTVYRKGKKEESEKKDNIEEDNK